MKRKEELCICVRAHSTSEPIRRKFWILIIFFVRSLWLLTAERPSVSLHTIFGKSPNFWYKLRFLEYRFRILTIVTYWSESLLLFIWDKKVILLLFDHYYFESLSITKQLHIFCVYILLLYHLFLWWNFRSFLLDSS